MVNEESETNNVSYPVLTEKQIAAETRRAERAAELEEDRIERAAADAEKFLAMGSK